jgi:hypothetical protein
MPEQMTLFFDDDSDWTPAEGWHSAKIHACAMTKVSDPRRYIGDGPQPGQIGIHRAGCQYRRDEA